MIEQGYTDKNIWKNIRINAKLYKLLEKQAKAEHRSVANMLEVIIAKALEK